MEMLSISHFLISNFQPAKDIMSGVPLDSNPDMSPQATGVEFPSVTHFWEGEAFRSLGAGVRQKKIAFVGVKVCC